MRALKHTTCLGGLETRQRDSYLSLVPWKLWQMIESYVSWSLLLKSVTVNINNAALHTTMRPGSTWLQFLRKNKILKVWKTEETLKRNSHVTLNRCLYLCYKHSTNHHSHPSLWSAAPLVCRQTISGCKFPSQILRISSGMSVRGCEETCLVLPGHCVSVRVWGWGCRLKGQSSTGIVKPK